MLFFHCRVNSYFFYIYWRNKVVWFHGGEVTLLCYLLLFFVTQQRIRKHLSEKYTDMFQFQENNVQKWNEGISVRDYDIITVGNLKSDLRRSRRQIHHLLADPVKLSNLACTWLMLRIKWTNGTAEEQVSTIENTRHRLITTNRIRKTPHLDHMKRHRQYIQLQSIIEGK